MFVLGGGGGGGGGEWESSENRDFFVFVKANG